MYNKLLNIIKDKYPDIIIEENSTTCKYASFNSRTRELKLNRESLMRIHSDVFNDVEWNYFVSGVLLHEVGHYLDRVVNRETDPSYLRSEMRASLKGYLFGVKVGLIVDLRYCGVIGLEKQGKIAKSTTNKIENYAIKGNLNKSHKVIEKLA